MQSFSGFNFTVVNAGTYYLQNQNEDIRDGGSSRSTPTQATASGYYFQVKS